eukprot:7071617-Alexandrium_andersonii.AAC.1
MVGRHGSKLELGTAVPKARCWARAIGVPGRSEVPECSFGLSRIPPYCLAIRCNRTLAITRAIA